MRPRDRALGDRIVEGLAEYNRTHRRLPGIATAEYRDVLREQLLESVHRVKFVDVMSRRPISPRRSDPNDELFDPLKAAVLHKRAGDFEEAFWLVFLFVHFGKNSRGGWRYAREVYGRLGGRERWDWRSVSSNPKAFRDWLRENQDRLRRPGIPGGFGNHRKRESLDADSATGTGAVVESYVSWVGPPKGHRELVQECLDRNAGDPRKTFHELYLSMDSVVRFGRLARFDYLTMIGKLGLAAIIADSPYLQGASGPRKGAALLFGREESAEVLDRWVIEIDGVLGVGMQVLEDALCNWQKSPGRFIAFRG